MSDHLINRRQIHMVDHFIGESLRASLTKWQQELAQIKHSIANLQLGGDSFRTMAVSYADSFLRGGHRSDLAQLKDLTIAYTAAAKAIAAGTDLSQDQVLLRIGIPIHPGPNQVPSPVEEPEAEDTKVTEFAG